MDAAAAYRADEGAAAAAAAAAWARCLAGGWSTSTASAARPRWGRGAGSGSADGSRARSSTSSGRMVPSELAPAERAGAARVLSLSSSEVSRRARVSGRGRDSAGSDARSSAAVRRVWRWRSRHCCSSSATLGRFRIRATTPERLPSPRYPGLAPRIASEVEARCQRRKSGRPPTQRRGRGREVWG